MATAILYIKKDIADIFKTNKLMIVILIVVLVLSYGFTITNYSMGIDDTALERYVDDKELLAQGRVSGPLLHKILGIYKFAPFWLDTLAVICLFFAVILWCAVLRKASNGKLNRAAYITFSACRCILIFSRSERISSSSIWPQTLLRVVCASCDVA